MPGNRSPKYPSIPLSKAIQLANVIWDKEKRSPVDIEIVAKHWGYNSVSGIVRSKVGVLRQFRLISGGSGALKVSDLAVSIKMHPPGSSEHSFAMHVAALSPPIFAHIHKNHRDASDESLKAVLVTQLEFNEDAAAQCIAAYRATIALVGPENGGEHILDRAGEEPTGDERLQQVGRTRNTPPQTSPGLFLRVPFRGAELQVRVELSGGQELSPDHLERVRAYLELAKKDLGGDD